MTTAIDPELTRRSEAVRFRGMALALFALTVLYLCGRLAAPFTTGFTWGLTLAIACAPLRSSLFKRMPRLPATLLIIGVVTLLIALPVTFVLSELIQESARTQQAARDWFASGNWRQTIAAHKILGPVWAWVDSEVDFTDFAQKAAGAVARWAGPALLKSGNAITQGSVALLSLFFFLRDQEALLDGVRRLLPFSPEDSELFIHRVSDAVRSSVYGRLLIGMLQGFLGGVIFALLGLPAPVFWGAVMAFFSVLPVLGAPAVWVPACVILVLSGHWIKATTMAVWGFAIIHPVDNFLYPVLVGEQLGLHPLALFVAFMGGLIAFGPAGLILGPCIVAVAAAMSDLWLNGTRLARLERRD